MLLGGPRWIYTQLGFFVLYVFQCLLDSPSWFVCSKSWKWWFWTLTCPYDNVLFPLYTVICYYCTFCRWKNQNFSKWEQKWSLCDEKPKIKNRIWKNSSSNHQTISGLIPQKNDFLSFLKLMEKLISGSEYAFAFFSYFEAKWDVWGIL